MSKIGKLLDTTPATLHREMQMRGVLIMSLLVVLAATGCSTHQSLSAHAKLEAPVAPEPYVRIFQADSNTVQLQLALRKFVPEKGKGPAVWLTAVSHLGESNYYATLQRHLDGQTLVLFEGIGKHPNASSKSVHHPKGQTESGRIAMESSGHNDPASLQAKMASSLGLEFQLEAIDYDRANFQNSDLSIEELRDLLTQHREPQEKSEAAVGFESLLELMHGNSIWSGIAQMGLTFLSASPKLQAFGKLTLIEMLGQMEGNLERLQGLPPQFHELLTVLIQKRNEKVLRDLKAALNKTNKHGSISIFYGTGHMPDMELHLRQQMHYRPADQIWLTAISVNIATAEISPAELAFIRAVVKRQFQDIKNTPANSGTGSGLEQPR